MNDAIVFSVLIPAFNSSETLAQTLESIREQKADCTWEALVVDDGSTDGTYELGKSYAALDNRIKVFTQPNGGTGSALNEAARHASGTFLVQLGSDDLLDSVYMQETYEFIKKNPQFDIYASNAFRLSSDHASSPCLKGAFFSKEREITFDDLVWSNKIYGTAALRRSFFEKVGGFHAGFYNEDYDLWLRLALEGARIIFQPQCLAYYRVVEGQKTQNTIKVRRGDIAILKALEKSEKLSRKQRMLVKLAEKQLQLKIVIKQTLGMR